MTYLRCHNKRCGYAWNYKGKHPFYATCPRCHYRVHIANNTITEAEYYVAIGLPVIAHKFCNSDEKEPQGE